MSKVIVEVDVVTAAGASQYRVGGYVLDRKIDSIRMSDIFITGDPYSHYCIYGENNEMLASINCLAPCVVTYG